MVFLCFQEQTEIASCTNENLIEKFYLELTIHEECNQGRYITFISTAV